MATITLRLETNHAAFDEARGDEVARILRAVADRYAADTAEAVTTLRDRNGNTCGSVTDEVRRGSSLTAVLAALARRGLDVTLEYPGVLAVPVSTGRTWHFGTANGVWGGDLCSPDGALTYRTVEFAGVWPDADPEAVARVIAAHLAEDAGDDDREDDDDDDDPNGCAECARAFGPHYTGPCTH